MSFWDLDVHTLKMKKTFWGNLLARRKSHLDTTMICAVAWKEWVDMYNTPTPEVLEIIQQLWEDLKQHDWDDKATRDGTCSVKKT